MRVELEQLSEEKRAQVAAAEQSGEPQPKVSLLEQRIRRLRESLETAVVVPAPPQPWNQVRFGANVTVKDAEGSETTYRIVGIDETDLERNWISWLSPLARALLNGQLGAQLRFHLPAGEQRLEIIRIDFKPGLDETGKGA
jgi:transcription elongation factor GreB